MEGKKKGAVMLNLKGVVLAGISLCASLAFTNCESGQEPQLQPQSGMFCWDEEVVDAPEEMEELIRELQITRWYQEFPEEPDREATSEFIAYMTGEGVSVDALVGSVEWGFEEDGASLIGSIGAISAYNKSVEPDRRIGGIMVDVEPYISKTFKNNREKYMEIYVRGMKEAYAYAKENGIRFIACIPRHYEEQGLTGGLEKLIGEACDEVAVMNYGRGNEVEMIETEARLAEEYGRELHCILEFQDVGKHGLTENETYRLEGIKEAQETWKAVREAFPDIQIIADYHWTRPLLEMLKEE